MWKAKGFTGATARSSSSQLCGEWRHAETSQRLRRNSDSPGDFYISGAISCARWERMRSIVGLVRVGASQGRRQRLHEQADRQRRNRQIHCRSALQSWRGDLALSDGVGFFQTHFRACQGSDAESGRRWRQAVYQGIDASLSLEEERLTIERQCQLWKA